MRSYNLECVIVWTVFPLLAMALWVGGLILLSSLLGGPAKMFGVFGLAASSYWVMKRSKHEPVFTKVLGWMFSLLLAACAVSMTGVLG